MVRAYAGLRTGDPTYRDSDKRISNKQLVLPMQYKAARKMATQLHSVHPGDNGLRRPNGPTHELQEVFGPLPTTEPLEIVIGDDNRTAEYFCPLAVGGVKVRMRDNDRFQSAIRVDLCLVIHL